MSKPQTSTPLAGRQVIAAVNVMIGNEFNFPDCAALAKHDDLAIDAVAIANRMCIEFCTRANLCCPLCDNEIFANSDHEADCAMGRYFKRLNDAASGKTKSGKTKN